jgi:hypothetical protein
MWKLPNCQKTTLSAQVRFAPRPVNSAAKVEFAEKLAPAPHHDQPDNTDNRLALAAVNEVGATEEVFYHRAQDNLRGVKRSRYVVFRAVPTCHQPVGQKRPLLIAASAVPQSEEALEFWP